MNSISLLQKNALIKKADWFILAAIWIIATAFNLNKAFHIDDTFHLLVAQWIEKHPLAPMSGIINWGKENVPIYTSNQPPLFFYLIAAIGKSFGYKEVPLHLLESIFSLLAIIYFYKLCNILIPRFSLLATALLAFNPAFLVNQNTMVDIPILSLSIIFIFLLVKNNSNSNIKNHFFAATILSAGLLIKYSLLPLYLILAISILNNWSIKQTPALTLPFLTITAWSIFNIYEFNSIHIIGRSNNIVLSSFTVHKLITYTVTLGSIATFSLFILAQHLRKENFKNIITIQLPIILLSTLYGISNKLNYKTPAFILWVSFLFVGSTLLFHVFKTLSDKSFHKNRIIIFTWFFTMALFIILFAPFISTRHVLLAIPPLIILVFQSLEHIEARTLFFTLICTVTLGFLLGMSDWAYSSFYRCASNKIAANLPKRSTIWTVGHWGWRWYSAQSGMKFYDEETSKPMVNDFFVYPLNVPLQPVSKNIILQEVGSIYQSPTWVTFFTTAKNASFYRTDISNVPWSFTVKPVDTVKVFRVISIK
ncbi:ArnT family glycosyltransferase [Sabulibacter ruber]|uniref:ArnT family glycosyltransferase n=1 Tax=Sabulibacter ruber TaxID=2811901 RepID=UPI001A973F6D|nr:glycosyltransferase family 39 protein [Sabulibacter ruber]